MSPVPVGLGFVACPDPAERTRSSLEDTPVGCGERVKRDGSVLCPPILGVPGLSRPLLRAWAGPAGSAWWDIAVPGRFHRPPSPGTALPGVTTLPDEP